MHAICGIRHPTPNVAVRYVASVAGQPASPQLYHGLSNEGLFVTRTEAALPCTHDGELAMLLRICYACVCVVRTRVFCTEKKNTKTLTKENGKNEPNGGYGCTARTRKGFHRVDHVAACSWPVAVKVNDFPPAMGATASSRPLNATFTRAFRWVLAAPST